MAKIYINSNKHQIDTENNNRSTAVQHQSTIACNNNLKY